MSKLTEKDVTIGNLTEAWLFEKRKRNQAEALLLVALKVQQKTTWGKAVMEYFGCSFDPIDILAEETKGEN